MNRTEELPLDLAVLRNAVSCELHAQLALRGERIDLAAVPEVAYAVAVALAQGFRITPAFDAASDPASDPALDDDESLGLDAATFHASAMPRDGADRYPVFDHGWPAAG